MANQNQNDQQNQQGNQGGGQQGGQQKPGQQQQNPGQQNQDNRVAISKNPASRARIGSGPLTVHEVLAGPPTRARPS